MNWKREKNNDEINKNNFPSHSPPKVIFSAPSPSGEWMERKAAYTHINLKYSLKHQIYPFHPLEGYKDPLW